MAMNTISELPKIIELVNVIDKFNKSRESKFRPKNEASHARTKTTRETQRISDETEAKLRTIVNKIEKEFENHRTYAVVYKEYQEEVGSIIADGVRQTYMLGFQFIEGFAGKTMEFNSQQADEMNGLIQDTIDRFWKKIEDLHNSMLIPNNPVEIKKIKIKDSILDDFIGALVSWATQISLGRGTMITLSQLSVERGIQYSVIWITEEDDKVCQLCYPLQGREFGVNEDQPEIPQHPNCRCRKLPIERDMVYVA